MPLQSFYIKFSHVNAMRYRHSPLHSFQVSMHLVSFIFKSLGKYKARVCFIIHSTQLSWEKTQNRRWKISTFMKVCFVWVKLPCHWVQSSSMEEHAVSEYIMTSCINCAAMFPPNLILDFSVTRLFQREAQTPVLVVATLPSLSIAPALQPHTGPGCWLTHFLRRLRLLPPCCTGTAPAAGLVRDTAIWVATCGTDCCQPAGRPVPPECWQPSGQALRAECWHCELPCPAPAARERHRADPCWSAPSPVPSPAACRDPSGRATPARAQPAAANDGFPQHS